MLLPLPRHRHVAESSGAPAADGEDAARVDAPAAERGQRGANDLAQALAEARARGLPKADPTRWRRIDALAQRAASQTGATRQLLDARLKALLGELADAAVAPPTSPETPAHASGSRGDSRPLHTLLSQLQSTDVSDEPRDLKVVHQHRAAWTQLRAEQRVAETGTALPDQAGPLNSQLLLHRALTLMRETAPGYLQHFMGQAEALMWLEQALAAPSAQAAAPSRGKSAKAPAARGRAPGKSARR